MVKNYKLSENVFSFWNYFLISVLSISCLYPIWYVLCASVSDPASFMRHNGPLILPLGFSLRGYGIVFNNPNITQGYLNTIIYVSVGTVLNVSLTSLGGYVLSRRAFPWKGQVMLFITFTMFFSGGMIPSYLVVRSLGLFNTRWAVILPGAISTMNLIITRTAMYSIPASLEESAIIDGANEFAVYWKIVMPLSKATLAVITLYYAVAIWNSWFGASIYLRSRRLFPLQIILREILLLNTSVADETQMFGDEALETYFTRELVKYCTIIVSTLPILCIYPFIQKYFVRGIMIGALKG